MPKFNESILQEFQADADGDRERYLSLAIREGIIRTIEHHNVSDVFPSEESYQTFVTFMLGHADHTFRRGLLDLDFKFRVYIDVGVWDGYINVDIPIGKYIDDIVDAIWGIIKSVIDTILEIYYLLLEIIDACLTCDEKEPRIFTNVFAEVYLPFLITFFACCFCCIFCCVGENQYDGCCLPCVMSLKELRGAACQAVSVAFGAVAGLCKCWENINNALCNKCLSCIGKCCKWTFLCPGLFFACFSLGNYGLERWVKKCRSTGKMATKAIWCLFLPLTALISRLVSIDKDDEDQEGAIKRACKATGVTVGYIILHSIVYLSIGYLIFNGTGPDDTLSNAMSSILTPIIETFTESFEQTPGLNKTLSAPELSSQPGSNGVSSLAGGSLVVDSSDAVQFTPAPTP